MTSYFYDSMISIPVFSWIENKAKIRQGSTACEVDGCEPFPSPALPTLGAMAAASLKWGQYLWLPGDAQSLPWLSSLPCCYQQKSRLLGFVSAPRRGVGAAGGGRHTHTDMYGYKYGDVKYMHPQARANTEGDF